MNKREFINAVAEKCPYCPKYMINLVVSAAFEAITETVGYGEEIRIPGFGRFWLQRMAPRTGRNAQTGEAVHIPARWMPRFKPGSRMIAAADEEIEVGHLTPEEIDMERAKLKEAIYSYVAKCDDR